MSYIVAVDGFRRAAKGSSGAVEGASGAEEGSRAAVWALVNVILEALIFT